MKSQTVEIFIADIETTVAELPGDMTEALQKCDELILAGIEENFENSMAADGTSWPARKDPSLTHPLLILDGDLKAYASGGGGEVEITADELVRTLPPGTSGTSLAGVRRHEFGDEEIMGTDGILARPYFGVSDETVDKCADVVADAVAEMFA